MTKKYYNDKNIHELTKYEDFLLKSVYYRSFFAVYTYH